MLEIDQLVSVYGRMEALHGVSLHVEAGEIVALVGANGAGKTTLMRAISGIQPIKSGRIVFDGECINPVPAYLRVSRGLAQVPEGRHVFNPLSVEDNLRLGAYRRTAAEARHDIAHVYDLFPALKARHDAPAGSLSGGGTAYTLNFGTVTLGAPAPTANRLNSLLCAAGIDEKFITLSLSVLDVTRRRLTLASAGHLAIMVRRAGGTVEEIGEDITGFPLGIVPESDYRQVDIDLNPGDVVAIFSDGVTDPRNLKEEIYHTKENPRLARRVAESSGGPDAIGRAILQEIREFSAGHEQVDDITLICFGPKPE